MARSEKDAWLRSGAGDLAEVDVEDVPVKGQSVRVRALPAAYSNQAISEAMEYRQVGRDQIATINSGRLEILQFLHGVIEPKFTLEEVEQIARTFGPAFNRVVAKIDEISGLDKDAIEAANARFRDSGNGAVGEDLDAGSTPAGDSRPAVPSGAG